jgi:hypothetical protein
VQWVNPQVIGKTRRNAAEERVLGVAVGAPGTLNRLGHGSMIVASPPGDHPMTP